MTKKDGKPCKKCGTNKWSKNRECETCRNERSKEWQKANAERNKENHRLWKQNNPKKCKQYTRNWCLNNPEKVIQKVKKWQGANPEKVRKIHKNWRHRNPDKLKAKDSHRRTKQTEAGGSYTAAEWKALCEQYDNRCLCCGQKEKLTADHVVPVIRGGSSNIDNIQPLCGRCNSSKGANATDYRTKPGIVRWIQERLFT